MGAGTRRRGRRAIATAGRRWRSIGATAAALAAVFALGAGAGFLLEHEPAPPVRRIAVDRSPPPAGPGSFLAGEVAAVGGGRLSLRTAEGAAELELAAGAVAEELRRADWRRFEPGAAVNLGGEQADFGLVFTGLVAIGAGEADGADGRQ